MQGKTVVWKYTKIKKEENGNYVNQYSFSFFVCVKVEIMKIGISNSKINEFNIKKLNRLVHRSLQKVSSPQCNWNVASN